MTITNTPIVHVTVEAHDRYGLNHVLSSDADSLKLQNAKYDCHCFGKLAQVEATAAKLQCSDAKIDEV